MALTCLFGDGGLGVGGVPASAAAGASGVVGLPAGLPSGSGRERV